MIPILHDADALTVVNGVLTFPTNRGLGALADCLSCKVHEVRNGEYELEMEYPVSGRRFRDLVAERLIEAAHDDTGRTEFFRIYRVTTPLDGRVTVNARHHSYVLSKVTVMPFVLDTATPSSALQALREFAVPDPGYSFLTDMQGTVPDFRVSEPSTLRSCLGGQEGSVLDRFGGEFEWVGSTVHLWMDRNQGIDSGVTVAYGKNITELNRVQDSADAWTGIFPYWKGENARNQEVIVVLEEGAIYAAGANAYAYPMVIPVDFSDTFEKAPTKTQLREAAREYVARNCVLSIPETIEVSFMNLWQTEEYARYAYLERLRLCDTLTVEHEGLGISYKAKIVEVTYDVLLERYESMVIGEARTDITDAIRTATEEATQQYVTTSAMQAAIQHGTQLILGGTGGHVVFGYNGEDGTATQDGGDTLEYIGWDPERRPSEIYILDTEDWQTAVDVLRMNRKGIGFSHNGINGPFHSAWTIDSRFYADYITAGRLDCSLIDVEHLDARAIDTGILRLIKRALNPSTGRYEPVLVNGQEIVTLYANADTGEVRIQADQFSLSLGGTGSQTIPDLVDSQLTEHDEVLMGYIQGLEEQLDGQVEWHFIHGRPTMNSTDASWAVTPNREWASDTDKQKHLGDCCYDLDSGKAYKFTSAAYGIYLSFDKKCKLYNSSDMVKVFSVNGSNYRFLKGLEANSIASASVFVPGNDVYIYWQTSGTSSQTYPAYGWKVTAKRGYGDPAYGVPGVAVSQSNMSDITFRNNKLPNWVTGTRDTTALESSHNPYQGGMAATYRWTPLGSTQVSDQYQWVEIQDEAILAALGAAAAAQDTADGKRRNFTSQPVPPYDVGDIWMDGNDIKTCIFPKTASQAFAASDWAKKNKYQDEAQLTAALQALDEHWSDEDTVFATLFTNGERGIKWDSANQKLYISMDMMKGGTIKLGGNAFSYGNGKLGLYDAYGNEIIWMDNTGLVMKNANGVQILKVNPTDGLKLCSPQGFGDETVQLLNGIIYGYLGNTLISMIDMSAQYGNGRRLVVRADPNNTQGVVVESNQTRFENATAGKEYAFFSIGENNLTSYYNKIYGLVNDSTAAILATFHTSGITFHVQYSAASDRRLKRNIRLVEDEALPLVRRFRVVSFDWRREGQPHVGMGLVAQDVREFLPELVSEGEDGMLGIRYGAIVPYLIKGMQEQQDRIDALEAWVAKLEAMLARVLEDDGR